MLTYSFKVGGISKLMSINNDNGRLIWYNFNPDPTQRMDTFSLTLGSFLSGIFDISFKQHSVQRYSSTPSLTVARRTMYIYIILHEAVALLLVFNGLAVSGYYLYKKCNPLAGDITNVNQMYPYYVMNIINYPCVPGKIMFLKGNNIVKAFIIHPCDPTVVICYLI